MSNVHHTRNIVLNLSFDKAFDLCIESVSQIKKCKITKENRANGKIEIKGGITWKTFGDKIEFNLKKIDGNRTDVEFSSKPVARTTLIDYGKNLQNVQIIERVLERHIQVVVE